MEIELFIKKFRDFGSDVIDCFTKGNCFYFAKILNWKFNDIGAKIVYNQVLGHFACLIDGTIYDINGVLGNDLDGWLIWDELKEYDSALYWRLVRDCT